MTQYRDEVERQLKLIKAEEWAKEVKHLHMHRLTTMWYETRPEDMKNGNVIDRTYNDGSIERTLPNGAIVFMNHEKLKGDALIDAWEREVGACVCGEVDCEDEYTHTTHGY